MTYVHKDLVPEGAEILTGTRGGKYFYRNGDPNGERIYIVEKKPVKACRSSRLKNSKFSQWLARQQSAS